MFNSEVGQNLPEPQSRPTETEDGTFEFSLKGSPMDFAVPLSIATEMGLEVSGPIAEMRIRFTDRESFETFLKKLLGAKNPSTDST